MYNVQCTLYNQETYLVYTIFSFIYVVFMYPLLWCLYPEMEFLNGIFSRVVSDSSFCLVFYSHYSALQMLFMKRLEFPCFAYFL